MYGFVEKKIADHLGIPCETFILNDGSNVAPIDVEYFNSIFRSIKNVWMEDGANEVSKPKIIESDVVGMKIILSIYWFDDRALDSLTTGETKESPKYLHIKSMGIGDQRFIAEEFLQKLMEFYTLERAVNINEDQDIGENIEVPDEIEIDNDAIREEELTAQNDTNGTEELEAVPVDTPIDEDEINSNEESIQEDVELKSKSIIDIGNELIDEFCNSTGSYLIDRELSDSGNFCIGLTGYGRLFNLSDVRRISDEIQKNIIVVTEGWTSTIKEYFKRKNTSEIMEHTVFMLFKPDSNVDFALISVSGFNYCYGEKSFKLYGVRAGSDINDKIQEVRQSNNLTSEEKEYRVKKIMMSQENSPYFKYDAVYRDTVTGVVWGVRDRCFIHFLLPQITENSTVFSVIMKEFSDRFLGRIPYSEMEDRDRIFQQKIFESNREEFIKFSVDNSKNVIEELRRLYRNAEEKYKKHMDEAMESGKMMTKYLDQIEAFDEDNFIKSQREKAQQAFDNTMAIDKVTTVFVEESTIHVYTSNIYANDERTGRWHDIGTFHIMIGMTGNEYNTSNTVRIMNTKYQIHGHQQGMQAPHVFSDGHICHGNLMTGMVNAYRRRDLFELIMQLIIFLGDANTDDAAGKYIDRWPEVTEEVAFGNCELNHEKVIEEIKEAEKKFDEAFSNSIPIHI